LSTPINSWKRNLKLKKEAKQTINQNINNIKDSLVKNKMFPIKHWNFKNLKENIDKLLTLCP
jgi:hypothetical protein